MNSLNFILHGVDSLNGSDVVRRMGWTLIHGIWQGLAMALALKAALTAMRGRNGLRASNVRYLLACGAMAIVFGAAIATFVMSGKPESIAVSRKIEPVTAAAPVVTIHSAPSPVLPAAPRQTPWMPIIVLCWALGVASLGVRQVGGWVAVQRLRWAVPLDDAAWIHGLSEMARQMGIRRIVRLLSSPRVNVPAVLGIIWPVIVIPLSIINGLSIEQTHAILAHELAHIRRHDYLVNLIQTALETIFFHHPAVHWISGQIRAAREDCCDDLAIAACGSRLDYARALVALEEKCQPGKMLALAATDDSLVRRIRRLLAPPRPRASIFRNRRMRGNLAALMVVMLVILPVGGRHFWHSRSQTARAGEPATRPTSRPTSPRKLQAGDELIVSIMDLMGEGTGETVKTCKISDSGQIGLPLIPPMLAAGMTQEELEKEIARQYAHALQLKDRRITVELIGHSTSVRVTVAKDGQIAVDGAPGNWDTLRDRLAKLSPDERATIFIALAADTGDVPVSVFFQQESTAQKLVDNLHLAYISVAGINHTATHPAATRPDRLIYISGNIPRPGVYALSDHWITIKQFLTEAGGVQDEQTAMLTLTRRSNGVETFPLRDVPLSSLMNGDQADLYMEPDDILQVTTANPVQNTSVRVTVRKDGQIAIDGAAGNWDALRDRLAKLSPDERAHTHIMLLLDTPDVPYSVLSQQLIAAKKLKDDLKLAYFAVSGTNHAESRPTSTRPD